MRDLTKLSIKELIGIVCYAVGDDDVMSVEESRRRVDAVESEINRRDAKRAELRDKAARYDALCAALVKLAQQSSQGFWPLIITGWDVDRFEIIEADGTGCKAPHDGASESIVEAIIKSVDSIKV